MSFGELVTAAWRNRVSVLIVAGIAFLLLFVGLFSFVAAFQAWVIGLLMMAVKFVILSLIVLFGVSVAWKATLGNFKGGGGKKK